MHINGFEFDFEGLPTSIQANSGDVQISTGKTQIEVIDGTLRVDGRSYGEVIQKDRISVAGDKVSVNGQARTSAD